AGGFEDADGAAIQKPEAQASAVQQRLQSLAGRQSRACALRLPVTDDLRHVDELQSRPVREFSERVGQRLRRGGGGSIRTCSPDMEWKPEQPAKQATHQQPGRWARASAVERCQ